MTSWQRLPCPMIGVPGKDRRRPVELFQQHGPGKQMRPGRLAERQQQVRLRPFVGAETKLKCELLRRGGRRHRAGAEADLHWSRSVLAHRPLISIDAGVR